MAAQGGYPLTCPAVAASCEMTVAVQDAGDDVVACNACKDSDGLDQLTGSLGAALTASTARKVQLGMHASFPMDGQKEFSLRAVHVD